MGGQDVDFEIPDEFKDTEKNRSEMKYPESRAESGVRSV